MLLGSVGLLKLMDHRRRVEWVNESLIEDGVMGCRGIHGEGGFFFFWENQGREDFYALSYLIFLSNKKYLLLDQEPMSPQTREEPEIFVQGGRFVLLTY